MTEKGIGIEILTWIIPRTKNTVTQEKILSVLITELP